MSDRAVYASIPWQEQVTFDDDDDEDDDDERYIYDMYNRMLYNYYLYSLLTQVDYWVHFIE